MAERRETYAYFWIEGFSCDPSQISATLQLEPHDFHRAGDLIKSRFERTAQRHYWPKSSWSYRSRLPLVEIFQDSHIVDILSVLEPRIAALLELQKTCETGINCVGYYWNSNPGFHLSAELIHRCAKLSLSIDFDLYNYPEEYEEAGTFCNCMVLPTPVLKGFECYQHDPIDAWIPVDEADVDFQLTLEIGPPDSEGADLYKVRVLTPQAISRNNLGKELSDKERRYMILSPYSWNAVIARVSEVLDVCVEDSYPDQTEPLKRHFEWEGVY